MKQEFKVGDIVEAFGVRGVVKRIGSHPIYPIDVELDFGSSETFTIDGRGYLWHKTPSLKLIERPIKM